MERRRLAVGIGLTCLLYILFSSHQTPISYQHIKLPTILRSKPKPFKFTNTYLTPEELREMVGPSPRFLVKDEATALGWNNIRYIMESTLILAKITGRIPIIPGVMLARDCVKSDDVCTKYAEYIQDRNHYGDFEWKWDFDGSIWRIPISEFMDLPRLRREYGPVLTVQEFYQLYKLNEHDISASGRWSKNVHLPPGLTQFVMEDKDWDPSPNLRVDDLPKDWQNALHAYNHLPDALRQAFKEHLHRDQNVLSLNDARDRLQLHGGYELDKALLMMSGLVPLYSYSYSFLVNKAVADPETEYGVLPKIIGLQQDIQAHHHAQNADIFYIHGYIHDGRKQGSLRFTSPEARDSFTQICIDNLRPPQRYIDMAATIATRMSEKVQGRKWAGVHLRIGKDIQRINWQGDADKAFAKMDEIKRLAAIKINDPTQVPLEDDVFYLATDERSEDELQKYRDEGAILLQDILTDADRNELGWQSNFYDLLALLEQQILAQADIFVGSRLSSVTGGVINQRLYINAQNPERNQRWTWSIQ